MKRARVEHRNATEGIRALASNSVDLVIADPPYDIAVGNKAWDKVKEYMPFARAWLTECVRALRPGGALLVYGSPERMHIARMSVLLVDELNLELVQDIPWVYTQGAPFVLPTPMHDLCNWWALMTREWVYLQAGMHAWKT
jgi:DNA modification methylase